ncbi:MAG: melibiose:sodium transporter MelB [Turicibacter sp.]
MRLTAKEKYSYGVGALGKDLVYAIVATYLMFYFTDVIGLAPAFVGTLFLVARMWDAFNDPAMGMIVDNTRSKWGKFRPWILIGTIINAVVLVFMFTKPDLEGPALYAYFSVMYILWGMTYTIMDIPYWSMLPSLSKDKEEREKISVIPRIFASCAWLIIGTFGLAIVSALGKGDEIAGYSVLAKVIAVIFVITSIITCLNVKEKVAPVAAKATEKVTLKQTFKIIKKNDQLVAFIGIVLAYNLVSQLAGGMALYYFKYVIGNEGLFPVFQAFASLAEISGLVLFPILARKYGRKVVFKFGCFLPVGGLGLLFIAGVFLPQNALLVAISGALFKLGSGFALGATTVMLSDVVDYGEFKLGTRNESIIFSCQTLLVKSASAVSGWLIGVGLTIVGYQANVVQTASTLVGMRVLMILVPSILAILSLVVYNKYYKLNNDFHDEVINELENRQKLAVAQ